MVTEPLEINPGRTHRGRAEEIPEARLPKQAPRRKNKCKIEWCRDLASRPVFSKPRDSVLRRGSGQPGETRPVVFPRQDENVGSLTLVEPRVGWQRGPRVVIYEVSKTLYTPTRQRAGLAPRNPVLALTHRYLSHDHFRPICAHRGLYIHARTYTGNRGPPHRGS